MAGAAVTFPPVLGVTDIASLAYRLAENGTTAIFGGATGGDANATLGGGSFTSGASSTSGCTDCDTTTYSVSGGTTNGSANGTEAAVVAMTYSVWLTAFLGILAGIVSVVTVVGNITVLLAFGLERAIRQPTNYFLASLAVSDLLIGTFSMPLYTQYLLRGNSWPLGAWLCDIWLSLDWTACLTSQYTVFLITMDRFLSVKIPAKYRNWRTERKVIVMIAVTWILPATVFFTSVIGWQYFVGERKVGETECEVQFMDDAMFTFLLTLGYFWITLTVMCCLYAGIYKVALDLQRKSDAKHKKMQHTMELAGENPQNAIRNFGEGGSNNNSSGGDSQVLPSSHNNSAKIKSSKNSRKSVKAALPVPAQPVNTTSFSSRHQQDKDDDRSSSPAFASDDENSSSGGATAPVGKSPGPPGYSSKSSSGVAGGGVVNSMLFANTGGLVRSLHGDLFFPGVGENLLQSQQPPAYTPRQDDHAPALTQQQQQQQPPAEVDSVYSSAASDKLEKQTVPLLQPQNDQSATDQEENANNMQPESEINRGCRFIDEKSLMATLSESAALLPAFAVDSELEDSDVADLQASSPIWKRRSSLPPIAGDAFDVDDEVSDYGITADMTTTTTLATATPLSSNSTRPTSGVSEKGDGDEKDKNGEDRSNNKGNNCGAVNNNAAVFPNAPPSESNTNDDSSRSDTHCLSAIRPRRNKDTRLHSFVKSVRSRNSRRQNRRERKSKSENRARKALRTISFILGAFVLCWTPYHINIMIYALCNDCVNDYFYSFSYWLCYLNSPINPFCYAFANAQFKRTFLRIMRFDWHRT